MDDNLRWRSIQRLIAAGSAIIALIVVGTAGYRLIEGMSMVDAIYMAVITVSTVGFGEIEPLSPAGRLFTIGLIVVGAGLAAYGLSGAAELVIAGEWRAYFEQRRRRKMIERLSGHTVICGYGRMGRHVADELHAQGLPFVVIDLSAETVERVRHAGYLALQGNAANEHYLHEAGIDRAKSLVATASSDAENVFIVLTARSLRPDLLIVARANYDDSELKLLRAGATRVLQPYRTSGRRMAALLIRPGVADFLDDLMHSNNSELVIDQVALCAGSPLVGRSLLEMNLRSQIGVTVLAVRGGSGRPDGAPGAEQLEAGAVLIALGTARQLQALADLAVGAGGAGAPQFDKIGAS